jgi:hypothetical protein
MTATKKLRKLTKREHSAAANLAAATVEFIQLQNRESHPAGEFDSARRFQPAETFECCNGLRMPSRSFPFSLMIHARTASHVAEIFKTEAADIKKIKRLWDKYEKGEHPENSTYHKILKATLDEKDFPAFTPEFRQNQIFKFAAAIILEKAKKEKNQICL